MIKILIPLLLTSVIARPETSLGTNALVKSDDAQKEIMKILRDDRIHPGEDGVYSFDFETEDGVLRSESGRRLEIEGQPIGQQGSYSYNLPNGERFELKFVADENGFQPESSWLPVAPEFPHPIPQFVLDQIAKAAREDAETAKA